MYFLLLHERTTVHNGGSSTVQPRFMVSGKIFTFVANGLLDEQRWAYVIWPVAFGKALSSNLATFSKQNLCLNKFNLKLLLRLLTCIICQMMLTFISINNYCTSLFFGLSVLSVLFIDFSFMYRLLTCFLLAAVYPTPSRWTGLFSTWLSMIRFRPFPLVTIMLYLMKDDKTRQGKWKKWCATQTFTPYSNLKIGRCKLCLNYYLKQS